MANIINDVMQGAQLSQNLRNNKYAMERQKMLDAQADEDRFDQKLEFERQRRRNNLLFDQGQEDRQRNLERGNLLFEQGQEDRQRQQRFEDQRFNQNNQAFNQKMLNSQLENQIKRNTLEATKTAIDQQNMLRAYEAMGRMLNSGQVDEATDEAAKYILNTSLGKDIIDDDPTTSKLVNDIFHTSQNPDYQGVPGYMLQLEINDGQGVRTAPMTENRSTDPRDNVMVIPEQITFETMKASADALISSPNPAQKQLGMEMMTALLGGAPQGPSKEDQAFERKLALEEVRQNNKLALQENRLNNAKELLTEKSKIPTAKKRENKQKIDQSKLILNQFEKIMEDPNFESAVGSFDNLAVKASGVFSTKDSIVNKKINRFINNTIVPLAKSLGTNPTDRDVKLIMETMPKTSDGHKVWRDWYQNEFKPAMDLRISNLNGEVQEEQSQEVDEAVDDISKPEFNIDDYMEY